MFGGGAINKKKKNLIKGILIQNTNTYKSN